MTVFCGWIEDCTSIAEININSPYLFGDVNAWYLKAPLYPSTIGKIKTKTGDQVWKIMY